MTQPLLLLPSKNRAMLDLLNAWEVALSTPVRDKDPLCSVGTVSVTQVS